MLTTNQKIGFIKVVRNKKGKQYVFTMTDIREVKACYDDNRAVSDNFNDLCEKYLRQNRKHLLECYKQNMLPGPFLMLEHEKKKLEDIVDEWNKKKNYIDNKVNKSTKKKSKRIAISTVCQIQLMELS